MIRISVAIEPRWTYDRHQGEIEIEEREVAGMTPEQRDAYINVVAADYVNEECPWGWQVIES